MTRYNRAGYVAKSSTAFYLTTFFLMLMVSSGVNAIVPPPTADVFFQFSVANYTVSEADGNATIDVTVSGCTDTMTSLTDCTVDFATTGDGSALPGSDYTPVSGTLSFSPSADGSGTQSFAVPILDDASVEDDETVGLALSDPRVWFSGNFSVAQLGTPSTATLTIISEDLPLAADPSALTLSGVPGETVEGTVAISGGVPPYTATSTIGATTEITNGTLNYSYIIPLDAAADISDTISVTDSLGVSITVPVTIQVGEGLSVFPASLDLSGVPGQTVGSTAAITGGASPYQASSAIGATTTLTNGTLNYSFTIPTHATADISDTVTITDDVGASTTIPVMIRVGQALTASPASLDLSGVPGEIVEDTISITGGAQPYQVSSTLGATTSISNGTLTYRYAIPSGASGTLSDTVTVVDSLGVTLQIPVRIDVGQSLSVSPDSLDLEGAAIGGTVSSAISVSGGTPPYLIVVTDGEGSVTPTRLEGAGEAIYSVTIPIETPSGTQLNAEITITDSGKMPQQRQVKVVIQDISGNPISSRNDLTPNQRSVAVAMETFCPELGRMDPSSLTPGQRDLLNQCTDLLSNADSSGIPNAMGQITTEKARASTSTSIEVGTQQLANVGSRLAALRRGAAGIDVSGLTLNIDGQSISGNHLSSLLSAGDTGGGASSDSESTFGNWGFFLNGNFNFGDKDETIHEAGFDFDTKGITAGADYRLSDKFILGGALGYAKNEVDFSSAGGDLDTDSWSLSAYGTYYLSDRIYIDGILGYGWNDFQSNRNIIYQVSQDSVSRTARSDYDGSQFGGSLGAGYIFNREALEFGVYGRLNYLSVDVDGFRETQASGLDLRVRGFDATSLTTSVGGRISRAYSTQTAVLVPQASFEWEHEFDNDASTLVAQFVNDPTDTAFEIFTDNPDRDYFRVGLGVTAVFTRGVSAFANYDTILAKDEWTDHAIDVGVRWEF